MLARILHIVLSAVFFIYVQIRRLFHNVTHFISALLNYHHKSPDVIRRDVKSLGKVPNHLSVILTLPKTKNDVTLLLHKLDIIAHQTCELVAWSSAAGIPVLSVYERTGLLKGSLMHLHRRIEQRLQDYYKSAMPTFSLRAPNIPDYNPSHDRDQNTSVERSPRTRHIDVLLLDASDGRQTLVELTKTLAEKMRPDDITPEIIDAEIGGMGEPDLLILFGDKVLLDGYPPWQVRLTEIFSLQDNNKFGYNCFLRALYKYAKAEMRLGR